MAQSDHIKNAFPEKWPTIQSERKDDAMLDEICTDFESLSEDVENAFSRHREMSEGLRSDYVSSIKALKLDILSRLTLRGVRSSTKKATKN
jgi:hypothetical protein